MSGPLGEDDDTVVLSPAPPSSTPAPLWRTRTLRPNRQTTVAAAVSGLLLLLSVTALGPNPPVPRATARPAQPLYRGAVGRLVFTLPLPSAAFEPPPERVWAFSLEDRSFDQGPAIPPVASSFPQPPGSSRALLPAPAGTSSTGLLALVASGPEAASSALVYTVDSRGTGLTRVAAPFAEGIASGWTRDGEVVVLARAIGGGVKVERENPGSRVRSMVGTLPSRLFPDVPGVSAAVVSMRRSLYVQVVTGKLFRVAAAGSKRVLRGWRVVAAAPQGPVLVGRRGVTSGARVPGALATWDGRGPPRPLATPIDIQAVLGWSRDGRFAAIATSDGRDGLWVVPLDGSKPTLALEGRFIGEAGEGIGPVAFTDDGTAMFFEYGFRMRAFDLRRKRMVRVPNPPGFPNLAPSGAVAWVP